MIGSALKKLAQENNMIVSGGMARGAFRGYAVTFSEGAGYKLMTISTKFPGESAQNYLENQLNEHDLMKEFRVRDLELYPEGVTVVFEDNPGTMKKFRAFVDWFFPLLAQVQATGHDLCCSCGLPFQGDETWQQMGDLVLHLHKGCAESLLRQAELEQRQEQEADTGTYGRGLLGALLGGLIGAVVWAVVLYFGYMAALVGLLIGWLTEVLYRKLGGKNGKVKILILLVAALLSVVVGTLGADALTLVQMISDGELYGSYGDILPFIGELLVTDSEYLTGTLLNIGLGMVFALLGMFGVLYQTHKETQKVKMKEIK